METYIINGQEVEYDTFELSNMELFDSEVRRIEAAVRGLDPQRAADGDYIAVLREQADNIMDFFDTVIGEGTSRKVFGGKVNIRDLSQAYRAFTQDVLQKQRTAFAVPSAPNTPGNREQRRAAERAQRRAAARHAASEKAHTQTNAAEPV